MIRSFWSYENKMVAICMLCFGVAGIVFFLSNYSGNYIALLLKLIPVFAAAVMLATRLVYYAFYYNNALYGLTGIPMAELLSAVVILVIGAVLSLLSARRERKKDLLTV